MLTTTISRYGDRIDRLTGEVAACATSEAAVEVRLDAKQAELDRAVAQLDVAKKRLAMMRAHLKRALVALRDRLVAIYETGTPDVLSVIVGANGYDDLIDRTEYLNRIHGNRRSDRRPGARTARPGQAHRRPACARPRTGSKRPATRSRPKSRLWPAPAPRSSSASRRWSPLAATRVAALKKIRKHEEELDGSVAAIQGEDRGAAGRLRLGAAAGRARSAAAAAAA